MVTLLLAARVFLASVFLFAGIAKMRDPAGTRRAALDFGVRELFAGPIAVALPFAEIGLAVGLLPRGSAPWAAAAIAALLLVFSFAITHSILDGRQVLCHCFGETQTSPVGWSSVARNVGLGGVAVAIAWRGASGPGLSMLAWWDGTAPFVRPAFAFVLLAAAGLGWAYGRSSSMRRRPDFLRQSEHGGIGVGAPVPAFDLPAANGERASASFLLGAPTLLVFWNPACGLCASMLAELRKAERARIAGAPRLLVLSAGAPAENLAAGLESPILLDDDLTLGTALGVPGSPSAVLVDAQGRVASDVAVSVPAITRLLGRPDTRAGTSGA